MSRAANSPIKLKVMYTSAVRVANRHLASQDPFAEMDDTTRSAFIGYMANLTFWTGSALGGTLQWVLKAWRTPGLRRWLAKHIKPTTDTLYYGGKLAAGQAVPAVGDLYPLPWKTLHWSTDRRTSEWFAAVRDDMATLPENDPKWVGGYLLEAHARPTEVVADTEALTQFCMRYKESFIAMMPRSDVVQLFTRGEHALENEVITTNRVIGTVVKVKMFSGSRVASGPDVAALSPHDRLRVFHGTDRAGFEELAGGIDALQTRVRQYGGPAHRGLFVTPVLSVANKFTPSGGVIVELNVQAKNLHGVDYSGNVGGKRDDDIFRSQFPNSFRPSLSERLLQHTEPQALLLGLVSPKDIVSVQIGGKTYTRSEAVKVLGIQDFGFDLSSPRTDIDAFFAAMRRTLGVSDSELVDIFKDYTDPIDLARDLRDPGHFGLHLGPIAAKAIAERLVQRFAH